MNARTLPGYGDSETFSSLVLARDPQLADDPPEPFEARQLAKSIAHDPAQLAALRNDGTPRNDSTLVYCDLRAKIDGRWMDLDEAGDVMRLRLMTGRHDEAEIIGRVITETLVAELDRLIASGRVS